MNHTKGEWKSVVGSTAGRYVTVKKKTGGDRIIARCGGKGRESNSDLISAAPNMFSALTAACELLEKLGMESSEEYQVGKAAIRKARTGQCETY